MARPMARLSPVMPRTRCQSIITWKNVRQPAPSKGAGLAGVGVDVKAVAAAGGHPHRRAGLAVDGHGDRWRLRRRPLHALEQLDREVGGGGVGLGHLDALGAAIDPLQQLRLEGHDRAGRRPSRRRPGRPRGRWRGGSRTGRSATGLRSLCCMESPQRELKRDLDDHPHRPSRMAEGGGKAPLADRGDRGGVELGHRADHHRARPARPDRPSRPRRAGRPGRRCARSGRCAGIRAPPARAPTGGRATSRSSWMASPLTPAIPGGAGGAACTPRPRARPPAALRTGSGSGGGPRAAAGPAAAAPPGAAPAGAGRRPGRPGRPGRPVRGPAARGRPRRREDGARSARAAAEPAAPG